jgi:hypothetical protein
MISLQSNSVLLHDVPLWFYHVPELQLCDGAYWFQILIQPVQQWYSRRYGHALNVFITNPINILDQCPDGIGMRDDDAFVPRPQARSDHRIVKGHDPIGRVLERLRSCPIKLLVRQFFVPSIVPMPVGMVVVHTGWSNIVGPSHLHYQFLI